VVEVVAALESIPLQHQVVVPVAAVAVKPQ
jgi:hypothetical protein